MPLLTRYRSNSPAHSVPKGSTLKPDGSITEWINTEPSEEAKRFFTKWRTQHIELDGQEGADVKARILNRFLNPKQSQIWKGFTIERTEAPNLYEIVRFHECPTELDGYTGKIQQIENLINAFHKNYRSPTQNIKSSTKAQSVHSELKALLNSIDEEWDSVWRKPQKHRVLAELDRAFKSTKNPSRKRASWRNVVRNLIDNNDGRWKPETLEWLFDLLQTKKEK